MNEAIISELMDSLDFQYMHGVEDFNSLTRQEQIDIILAHIHDNLLNQAHTMYETRHSDEATLERSKDIISWAVADLVFRSKGDYCGYREVYMNRFHPIHAGGDASASLPPTTPKKMLSLALKSKNREMVLWALRADREYKIYTNDELEDILVKNWTWHLVENATHERWESFCKSYGGQSSSGPTIDEWCPRQLGDEFYNLDGYITIPKHVFQTKEEESPRPWAQSMLSWVSKLEEDIVKWCEWQPDIISHEDPFVWGEVLNVCPSTLEIQIQVSVSVTISLAEMILQ